MDKLVDMKRSAPDEKSGCDCLPCPVDRDDYYPYGLVITLDSEEIEKLGITALPSVGGSIDGKFCGTVTAARKEMGGGDSMSVSIQITALALGPFLPAPADTAAPPAARGARPAIVE